MVLNRTKSEVLYKEALQYFPGGVNSPVRAFKSVGGTPLFFKKGIGSKVWDEDGNGFIDFCGSWGPLIHGHCHPRIIEAVNAAVADGASFGAPTERENKLAEFIIQNHRYLQKIRFVSSGTEAVMSALRLARGVTGRSKIIKFEGCYHGHVDALLVKAGSGLVTLGTGSSAGVPASYVAETIVLPLGDVQAVEQAFKIWPGDIAAVIIEPVPANNGLLLQGEDFLNHLRQMCTIHGALLIFDEVISGFRLGFEGASGLYKIAPDIITFGKIIGGGMPVGAYGGSASIMANIAPDGPVYQAGTLSGNPVAMAAGLASLQLCLEDGFYHSLENHTTQLAAELNQFACEKGISFFVAHLGSIFWLSFASTPAHRADEIDAGRMSYFNRMHALMLESGIYLGPSGYEVGFVSGAHSDADMDYTLQTFKKVLMEIF